MPPRTNAKDQPPAETQNLEWKRDWRDEYLKWICGFANAQGGVLEIGKDDSGRVVGIPDATKLLEDLPNKMRDVLGIMADVDRVTQDGRDFLRVTVEPYPYPISHKGEYHYRSGATKQVLKGAALDRFLLRKQGRTWDGVPMPHVAARELSREAIAEFRRLARQSRRLEAGVLREPAAALIEKLDLLDGGHLKRAAVLLFHPRPEHWFSGAFIKIGYFRAESELLYHDEIRGGLFTQTHKAVEVLFFKYLKAAVGYRGIQRVETFPVPEDALREALLNAVIHRDYAVGAPIQIRVYPDRLKIWNPGELPEQWTADRLRRPHPSRPFNPAVANTFFRAGEIEAWGQGIQRMLNACREAGTPEPRIRVEPGDLWIEFPFPPAYLEAISTPARVRGIEDATAKGSVKSSVKSSVKIVELILQNAETTIPEMARILGMTRRAVEKQLRNLREKNIVRRIGPDKGGHWEVIGKDAD